MYAILHFLLILNYFPTLILIQKLWHIRRKESICCAYQSVHNTFLGRNLRRFIDQSYHLSNSQLPTAKSSLLHFLRLIPGRGRRSGSVVSKSFCRLHLLAPPAVPACPGSQDRAISLWVCLLVAFRGSPCPSLV